MTVPSVPTISAVDVLKNEPMRVQTACNLVVRLTWDVSEGHNHPRHTYVCVQDEPMAVMVAMRAGEYTHARSVSSRPTPPRLPADTGRGSRWSSPVPPDDRDPAGHRSPNP